VSETAEEIKYPAPGWEVPTLIQAAGDGAVCAYREYLDNPRWRPVTRDQYGMRLRRFWCWTESRGLYAHGPTSPIAQAVDRHVLGMRVAIE
jgi:hypothetical protein